MLSITINSSIEETEQKKPKKKTGKFLKRKSKQKKYLFFNIEKRKNKAHRNRKQKRIYKIMKQIEKGSKRKSQKSKKK